MSHSEALKLVAPAPLPALATITWSPADVAKFLRTSEELSRRRIAALEAAGAKLRVPAALAGRRVLIFASRFLEAAGLSEAEIQAALGSAR